MELPEQMEVRKEYVLADFDFSELTDLYILKHVNERVDTGVKGFYDLVPEHIDIDVVFFTQPTSIIPFPGVGISQRDRQTLITCGCTDANPKLCSHQAQALYNILSRPSLRLFFDQKLRKEKMKQQAKDYGLEAEHNLTNFFELEYQQGQTQIKAKMKEMFPLNGESKQDLKKSLLPKEGLQLPTSGGLKPKHKMGLVFGQHRFYSHLTLEIIEAQTTLEGKFKNPIQTISPSDLLWKTEDTAALKFYSGILKFQNNYNAERSDSDLDALRAVARNPLKMDVFLHDAKVSSNITANAIIPVQLNTLSVDMALHVSQRHEFYEVSGKLTLNGTAYALDQIQLKYNYFIQMDQCLHLIDNPNFLRVIDFFKQHHDKMLIHHSKFEAFQEDILSKLESKIKVTYDYLKPATKKQIEEKGFDLENEQVIYLSESEDFVLLTPVMRYGNLEIPVLSRKQIQSRDRNGNLFTLNRDAETELQFISNIMRQHPYFEEQMESNDCFYLHKTRLLEEQWFLHAFEAWRNKNISILGFNQLKDNNLNPYKANISIQVMSGIDWFKTAVKLKYGNQVVSLRHLHKSIRNKNKFVKLDDGTMGILPDEWIEKFSKYFNAGEIVDEHIQTPRISFTAIEELYESQLLDESVKDQLAMYKNKLSGSAATITDIKVPEGLNATLRQYQKEGLNWLSFLDEFNFGACLADDMGLGKTIQIIAFILAQREKGQHNTNLIVVPASLIFNWQQEILKFAPSIKVMTIYGADRVKNHKDFDQFEVVLTSYGTLLTDIRFLKDYRFNYVFLDESQTIKNPESQRYKSVRLLQSRNKVVLTGTPIENNTFDLYGQLSFACPGLLGSKQHFREIYSTPIDQFKDRRAAMQLQQRISPFLLRRTKEQVAKELPDKTEMVIYCEMEADQRKVYDGYEKEIRDYLTNQTDEEVASNTMNVLKGITKLRQICNSPALLSEDEFYGSSSAKMEVLLEQIENKSTQHKILVFSQFVGMLDLIRKELKDRGIAFAYLTGQTKNREAVVDSFQNKPEIRVFLISLKAGGVGLNLTQADYVYLVDPWWNPAVENQAIDRTYRIGQQKNVIAVRLICPDTIEEKIMKLQSSKKELVKDLIKTDASIFKSLSKKDLLALFS